MAGLWQASAGDRKYFSENGLELPFHLRFDFIEGPKQFPDCLPDVLNDHPSDERFNAERLMQSHPEWSDEDALAAVRKAGLRFGPNEKQQLLQGLPLKALAEIYGPLRIQHATFDLMREHEKDAEWWFTGLQWDISAEVRFETNNHNPPKYFAIPLFNCVSETGYRVYGDHPLRIYSAPAVPDHLPKDKKLIATIKANERNSIICFFIDGQVCFIERLPDFDDRVASLHSGGQRRITAVMVGEVGSHPSDTIANFRSWFRSDILAVLGFGSGVDVGFPWIEIRTPMAN